MKKEIQKILTKALKELNYKINEVIVDYSKNEAFGDYTSNVAMTLSREVKKNPMEIAEEIKGKILNNEDFEKVEVVKPGYINFYLSKKYLQNKVQEINELGDKFGNLENQGKVMVEYSQPNTHKEFHIGHLRNVIIGSSLLELLKKSGQNVIAANYIGDTGTHIGKILWSLKKFYNENDLEEAKDKVEFLGKAYSRATQEIENNSEYEKEFKDLQKKFEAGDAELTALWQKTRQWSLDEFAHIYKKLGVNFDVYFYESEEEIEGKKMLPELLKSGIIKESEGAIIADLEKWNLGVLVLQRSDGAALYGLKDIPLAIKKFKEYKIEKSIYVVDVRQSLYLSQIFKILFEIGFKEEMIHVGYDFVSLKGGEGMSSRKGNIIPANFLLSQVENKVKEKFPNSPNSEDISLGAIKFFMLKYSPRNKIEFDIDESVRLEGSTGPYVQYAHARICSILEKAKELNLKESKNLESLTHEKELNLIRELNKFPEIIEDISKSYEVHKLPYYVLLVADKFHSFYNDCVVIDEKNLELTKARLKLIDAVRITIKEALRILGVNAPNKM